jgi:TctA family transporter
MIKADRAAGAALVLTGLFVLWESRTLSLRQSLSLSDGSYAIFVERPITAVLLGLGLGLVLLSLRPLLARDLDWRAKLGLAGKERVS